MNVLDWDNYPNFSVEEFRCNHSGLVNMDPYFMDRLQGLRSAFGLPMVVVSGYRHITHPIEAAKPIAGAHATGRACDVRIHGADALHLVVLAVEHGFTGVGVHQRGSRRFIHLDDLPGSPNQPRPWIWSY